VCPSGAQVRRRVGISKKPLSSRKARCAPRVRAFFNGGPGLALPVRDGLFVALDGSALGNLAAPTQAASHLPHVWRMIAMRRQMAGVRFASLISIARRIASL
jgi:hypothetical protein